MSEWTHRGRIWSDARKRRLADIGVTVIEGSKGPRLVAWMRPRGELAGRQYLARVCRAKIDNVMLASEDELQYPGWTQVEDAVVWIDRDLKPTTDLNVLVDETAVRSKEFYKAARVAVEKLAAGL